jgi:hypothetical protein
VVFVLADQGLGTMLQVIAEAVTAVVHQANAGTTRLEG